MTTERRTGVESSGETTLTGSSFAVLVVEDDEDNAETLLDVLQQSGHRVSVAASASRALEILEKALPDVVLLDVGLPDMDGYEVARAIRRRHGKGLRIVALTGFSDAASRERARLAGFDAFVVKPSSIDDLKAVLAERAP